MKRQHILPALVLVLGALVWLMPDHAAQAQLNTDASLQDRCWTQTECESGNGVWGKSDAYRATIGGGSSDQWSVNVCQDIAAQPTARCFATNPAITLQIGIPGVTDKFCSVYTLGAEPTKCSTDADCGSDKGQCRPGIRGGFPGYFQAFYRFFIALLAVSAVVMAMWGGFKRIMAAGSPEKIKDSNDAIISAITGLVLALVSYSLLNLINPRLVANTFAGVEKVKTQFTGFCPAYNSNPSVYQAGYSIFSCVGGSKAGQICSDDSQCPGGSCAAGSKTVQPPGGTCGEQLVINNSRCIGQECSSANQGCFSIPGSDTSRYACSDYMLQGSLSGVAITNLDLMMVCNNNTTSAFDCSVSEPNGSNEDTTDVKNHASYALNGCWANDGNGNFNRLSQTYCSGAGGLKGVALLAQVQAPGVCINQISGHGLGCDDWYAIDASSCGAPATKPICGAASGYSCSSDNMSDPKGGITLRIPPIDWRLHWDTVSQSQLFQPFDANGNMTPIRCNLSINRADFPDRNDVY